MTAMLLTTPNHKMGHDFMKSFTPSRMDDSLLHKMIFSTPNNFTVSTPITPSSTSQSSAMSKYVNLGTIGEGSYGLVLKCKDRQNGRVVAIKKFIESEEDKSVRKIAMREIHLLKQLRHENLVNLLEVFRRKRRLYLVFEFVEKSLLDHLDMSPSGLERGQCRRILYQVIRALEFCHIHNIIHRDVKPENILISKHGVVKLCDFGFARTLAKPGEIYTEYVSTRWYRAPELLVGDARYGRAVDIWALGCLSAEMLTGQPLFPGDSDIDQLFSIVKCFGCLCRRHEDRLYSSPMFRFEISQIEVTEPLKCRLRGCTSREFQFVASCLELDPQDRPTCSSLMRHPLFTCDGFNSWFPEELQQMLKRDADEHKLHPERPKPRRQLPDLNKCFQLSSTPIKGYDQVTPLSHSPHHTPDPGQNHHHKHPAKDLPCKTHRNLEEAFGSCVVAAADEGLHNTSRDDVPAPRDEPVHSSLNFDLQPLDLSSSFNNNISSTTCLDLDLSFSHLSIVEGIEVEGEESPHKFTNVDEEDDYASEANEGDYASEDDDYAEDGVRAVRGKSQKFEEGLNYEGGDRTNSQLHPVSLLSSDSQKKLNNINNSTSNNTKNSNNNCNNQSKKKKQNSKAHQSLPMSSSSSSSASSSSPMTSLPSPSSSATTSGVSSPTSSSSSSSSSSCTMRKFSKNSTNNIKHFNNNNNRNNINNNTKNSINNSRNNNNINNNSRNNNINNSSNNLNQSPRGSHTDVTGKSQNQKSTHQPWTTNAKSNKQHTNNYKPDSVHHHYQHQQQQQQQGRAPCKPLQQKNVIHPFHQQPRHQQQSQCKQVENESPKFGQKFSHQPKYQNSHQKHQQQQQQQNVQPKPTKKKDFGQQNPSTSKQVAKQPIRTNNGQSKIAYRNS